MSIVKLLVLTTMFASYQAGEAPNVPSVEVPPVAQVGLASWYGSGDGTNDGGLHGAITATGERFDPSLQTCASRHIPLNTMVLVEDVKSGRRAWCRVNDRGPYGAMFEGGWVLKIRRSDPGRWRGVMDLSRGTAKALGFNFRSGLNQVRLRYHRDPTPARYAFARRPLSF